MKLSLSRSPSSFKARVEEAIARTLGDRFLDTIPKTIPDCYIDLLPRGEKQNTNMAIFSETAQIESVETDEESSAEFLASRKVKTVGLLDHLAISKMFIKRTQDELKNEIAAHTKSYKDRNNPDNTVTDGFVFEGADERIFGYTDTLLPHTKSQIAARFSAFLKSGGAVVSIQSRILPMTRLALYEEEISAPIGSEQSVLFCEATEHAIHVWIAVNCGNKIFSPLVTELRLVDTSSLMPHLRYSIESVCSQTEKQYRMQNPSLAILIDGLENNANLDGIHRLLSETCNGNVLEMSKNLSRNASLYGAILLGGAAL
jgi:hypothetical protein